MDFGDLLLLIFIVAGLLSSLAGGKKKRKGVPQARPRPGPRPQRPPSPRRPGGTARPREAPRPEPSLDPGARPVPTQMEEILRQLGLDVGREPEVEEPEPAVEREAEPLSIPLRDEPRVVSLEEEALNLPDADREQLHSEFHQRYIRPLESVERGSRSSQARLRLNPTTLREAIILREILGPPKGLR